MANALRTLHTTALFSLTLLSACAASIDPAEEEGLAGASPAQSLANNTPKLYIMDCGRIELTNVSAFGLTDKQTPVRKLFVPCYLIEHPAGRLLFDLGLPADIAGQGAVEYEAGSFMQQDRSLLAQLEDLGLSADDIDFISISHGHFDHIGAANNFPAATVVLQRTEYEAAFEHPERYEVYVPELYAGLKEATFRLLDGDHDLFGDGTVQFIATPGHTPGHQALLVNLAEFGPVLLSGDLYHFAESRALQSVPIFNTDRVQTLASMKKVEQLLASTGATLWIEHNLILAQSLRKAPDFYE